MTLDTLGNVTELVFEDGSDGWYQRSELLKSSGISHLFYDPLDDGMEYIWLSWHAIDQPVMERLIGKAFTPSDLQPIPQLERRAQEQAAPSGFPSSWGVMF